MPTSPEILGFTNRWYSDSLKYSNGLEMEGVRFRVITPPYFLGTKLEAFHGRGNRDFMLSHDMEDAIAVLDGRIGLVEEIREARDAIRAYLAHEFSVLLHDENFKGALPGHLPGDAASQQRVPLILDRMRRIAQDA